MAKPGYQLETLQVTVDEHIALVAINRPDALNAVSMKVLGDLAVCIPALEDDPEVYVVVLTGVGRAFSVGADLKERAGMTLQDVRRRRRLGPKIYGGLANCQKPTIAAIRGYALGGGCELALCCDMLIAAENTQFALPETALGVIPAGGGTQRLPRLIGPLLAKELIFTGRRFTAAQAFAYGMLNRVVPDDRLMDDAMALARGIAANAPVALYQAKRAINASLNLDIESGLQFESDAYQVALNTEDRNEGLAAAREKRKPNFKGF